MCQEAQTQSWMYPVMFSIKHRTDHQSNCSVQTGTNTPTDQYRGARVVVDRCSTALYFELKKNFFFLDIKPNILYNKLESLAAYAGTLHVYMKGNN